MPKKCQECLKNINKNHLEDLNFQVEQAYGDAFAEVEKLANANFDLFIDEEGKDKFLRKLKGEGK